MAGDATSVFSVTTAGTNAGATATQAAATGKIHIVRHISGHTDADSIIQVLGGAAGATVIFETKIDVSLNGFGFAISIPDGIVGVPGVAVSGVIATSTADCQVNISGYSVP